MLIMREQGNAVLPRGSLTPSGCVLGPARPLGSGHAARGVTLIELIVTVTILSLLLAVAMPAVSVWIRNTQIRNVATTILSGLQRARAEAIRRNEPVQFSLVSLSSDLSMDNSCALSETGLSWVVSLDDPAGNCAEASSDTVAPRIVDKLAAGRAANWVTVLASQADGGPASFVQFNGFGRPVGANSITEITVDNESPGDDYRTLRIVIGAGGTTRMCEPKVNVASDPRAC